MRAILLLMLLTPCPGSSQQWAWVIKSHGERTVTPMHMTTDPYGNTYFLLNGASAFTVQNLALDSGTHLFRVTNGGLVTWSKMITYTVEVMTTDPEGNVYVGGHFYDSLIGATFTYDTDHPEFYLVKISPNGSEKWALRGDAPLGKPALAADAMQNVYIGGTYGKADSLMFNNRLTIHDSASTVFLAKVGISGQTEWVQRKYKKDSLDLGSIEQLVIDATGRARALAKGRACKLCFSDYLVQFDEFGLVRSFSMISNAFNPEWWFPSAYSMVSNGTLFGVHYPGYRYDNGTVNIYDLDGRYKWKFELGGSLGCVTIGGYRFDQQNNFLTYGEYLPRDGYCSGLRPSYDVYLSRYTTPEKLESEKEIKGKGEEFVFQVTNDNSGNRYVTGQFNRHKWESYGLLNQEVIFDDHVIKAETGTPQFFLAKLGNASVPVKPEPKAEEVVGLEKTDDFWFYPNPVTGSTKLYAGSAGVLNVFDACGKPMGEWTIGEGNTDVPFSEWPTGIYIAKFTCDLGTKTRKLIVR
jgi:hypothetical protein